MYCDLNGYIFKKPNKSIRFIAITLLFISPCKAYEATHTLSVNVTMLEATSFNATPNNVSLNVTVNQ